MHRKLYLAVLVLLSLLVMGCSKSDSEIKSKKDGKDTTFQDWSKKAPREPLPKPGHVLK